MHRVGFSGPRKGMTPEQKAKFKELIEELCRTKPSVELHHGDCIGADEEADDIFNRWSALYAYVYNEIIVHPPIDKKWRAFVKMKHHFVSITLRAPRSYHVRNDNIIYEINEMIAAAPSFEEIKRGSGTWSVIRKTRKVGKKLTVIYPDGSIA